MYFVVVTCSYCSVAGWSITIDVVTDELVEEDPYGVDHQTRVYIRLSHQHVLRIDHLGTPILGEMRRGWRKTRKVKKERLGA